MKLNDLQTLQAIIDELAWTTPDRSIDILHRHGGSPRYTSLAGRFGFCRTKHIDAAIAIVPRDGKVLICQRKDNNSFGGY